MSFDPLASLRSLPESKRRRIYLTALAIGLTVAILAALHVGHIFVLADSASYLDMAAGRPAMLPFSSRQLAPLLVRLLSQVSGLSLHAAFFVSGAIALLISFSLILRFVLRSGAPRWMVPAVAGMFFWTMQYNGLVLPDIWYTTLLACLLLLLSQQRMMAAALMMFPLMVSRESTMLTLVCLLLAGWGRLRWREMGVAVGAAAGGAVVVKHLAAGSGGNAESISPLIYLLAKLPWNFAKNFLGISLYADSVSPCVNAATPLWQVPLHLGRTHAVGICGYDPWLQQWLFYEALAVFALLLPLAWRLRRVRVPGTPRENLMLRFAVVYGTISFLLAGALGTAVPRLFAYSWPLFLVAVPMWAGASGANFTAPRWAGLFLLLHLSLTWLNWQMEKPLLLLALVLFAAGCWLSLKTYRLPAVNAAGA